MRNLAIAINHLSIHFKQKPVFSNLSLEVEENQFIAILGRSGCGKSTLLKALAGLIDSSLIASGSITSCFQPLSQQIAYLPQSDCLLPWLNALENTLLFSRLSSKHHAEHDKDKARQLLSAFGLGESLNLYPHQLSGGMRQRVALARTLMQDKPIILMDEPFSSLDAITRSELHRLTKKVVTNKTVIMVTHDPAEALFFTNEIYTLHNTDNPLKRMNISELTPPAKAQTMLFDLLQNQKEVT